MPVKLFICFSLTEALNRTYALEIKFTENGAIQQYKLNMPGSKTIGEVCILLFL